MERNKRSRVGDPEEGGEMGSMPEGCIANLIAFTSPRDACRLSAVSTLFKSAAESDAVWERFLPPDYQSLISESEGSTSSSSSSLLSLPSKKEIYLNLCDNPIIIDEGKKSFWLDKWSGKKCYMIAARELYIVWSGIPEYWSWTSLHDARFREVAELRAVCWLEIGGKISTSLLSPRTLYTAYLVFKRTTEIYGFEGLPVNVSVRLVEGESHVELVENESHRRSVYLHVLSERERRQQNRRWIHRRLGHASLPNENDGHPKERRDAWLEVELGDFYNAGDDEGELGMALWQTRAGNWKGGLVVQGIELRPKRLNI